MLTYAKQLARRIVENMMSDHSLKTLLLAARIVLVFGVAGNATAVVLIQDFFGSTNDAGANGAPTRHDAAGNIVFIGAGSHGPTLSGIDGLRAQFPDTSDEVW